jgi:hypothetical protein
VLPSSRSVELGTTATAFATLINGGSAGVTGCGIAPINPVSASFTYQTTNPATNAVTGRPNTPVNLAAGASQSFVIAFSPSAPFDPSDVRICLLEPCRPADRSRPQHAALLGLGDTMTDIVPLAATPSDDGILHLAGTSGANAFAVATVNLRRRHNHGVGQSAASGSATIAANATPTFAIFAAATGNIPFIPQTNRIFVDFNDASGNVRGSTSVAVEPQ